MIETFVLMELARQLTWCQERARLYHYRTKDKVEVDAILETPDGRVVAIEVKAGATVRSEDLAGLRHIAQRLGPRLVAGYVLYTGQQTLPSETACAPSRSKPYGTPNPDNCPSASPHRGRTNRLARPSRPDRDPAPDSDRTTGDPAMKAPKATTRGSSGPPAPPPLNKLPAPPPGRSSNSMVTVDHRSACDPAIGR